MVPFGFRAEYANQSLLCSSFNSWFRGPKTFFASVINLSDGAMTHRIVDAPYEQTEEDVSLFVLNDRIYMLVIGEGNNNVELRRVLLWDTDQWRPVNGQFPYVLANQKSYGLQVTLRRQKGQPDVLYIANECNSDDNGRYDFHRLSVSSDRVTIKHVGGFQIPNHKKVNAFAVWNDKLVAFLPEEHGKVKRYTMPIGDGSSNVGANSTGISIESVPELVDGAGYQVDNFVVFKAGFKVSPDATEAARIGTATIYDLNTNQVTETNVEFDPANPVVVDEETNRIYWVFPYGQIKYVIVSA